MNSRQARGARRIDLRRLRFIPGITDSATIPCVYLRCQEFHEILFEMGFDENVSADATKLAEKTAISAIQTGFADTLNNRPAWLWTVTYLNACSLSRRAPRFVSFEVLQWQPAARESDGQDPLGREELMTSIHEAIAALSDKQRDAVLVWWERGLSLRQGADELNMTLGTFRHHLARGLHRIGEILSDNLGLISPENPPKA